MLKLTGRIALVVALGLVTSLANGQQMAGSPPATTKAAKAEKAKLGERAPEFALKDADGKTHRLSDYEGKIVVLQWINPGCPVCKGCMNSGAVATMLSECKQADAEFVFLPINSTHFMEAKDTAAYLKKHKIDTPGLIDRDGTVGHLYGAKTTPHVFVIDKAGILRYDGAIDSARRGGDDAETVNYTVMAVRAVSAGETVSPDKTKPYGCGVKYDKKKKKAKR
jgi:peroxiredoxin